MSLSESALDLLREALEGETNPHLQLILLEQGSVFCKLPPDLEAMRSELSGRLDPFPIPPVVDAKSWGRRSSPGSGPVVTEGSKTRSKPSP
jgi:hypothetical protein